MDAIYLTGLAFLFVVSFFITMYFSREIAVKYNMKKKYAQAKSNFVSAIVLGITMSFIIALAVHFLNEKYFQGDTRGTPFSGIWFFVVNGFLFASLTLYYWRKLVLELPAELSMHADVLIGKIRQSLQSIEGRQGKELHNSWVAATQFLQTAQNNALDAEKSAAQAEEAANKKSEELQRDAQTVMTNVATHQEALAEELEKRIGALRAEYAGKMQASQREAEEQSASLLQQANELVKAVPTVIERLTQDASNFRTGAVSEVRLNVHETKAAWKRTKLADLQELMSDLVAFKDSIDAQGLVVPDQLLIEIDLVDASISVAQAENVEFKVPTAPWQQDQEPTS